MATRRVEFKSADDPLARVSVHADPQTVVTEGDYPGTAVVTEPNGRQVRVVGDYRDVHIKIQAAAAVAHESDPPLE